MKKLIAVCILFASFLSGCSSDDDSVGEAEMKVYQDYKDKLLINNGTLTYNIPFSYKIVVDKLEDNTYSYTVIVDKPLVSMGNIQMMSLIASQVDANKMEPTLGVLDKDSFSMIPNQVDVEKGFPAGVALNGISKEKDFTVFVVVSWHDNKSNVDEKAFFSFDVVDGVGTEEVDADES